MDNFSNLMMVGECLLDFKRGYAFKKAILKTVKKGDVVLDAGTGSGIMSFFAVKAGASKVFAVEIDSGIADITKNNIKVNGFESKIEVVNSDLKNIANIIKTPVDVLIMEMMDTALIAEQQIPAINALYKANIVNNQTKFIPCRMENFLQFTNYNYNFFGFNMPFIIQARNFGTIKRVKRYFSEKIKIADISLNVPNKIDFISEFEFKSTFDGEINSAVISSLTYLTSDISIGATSDMNMPVVLKLDSIKVKKNQIIKGVISYKFAEGFANLKIKLES